MLELLKKRTLPILLVVASCMVLVTAASGCHRAAGPDVLANAYELGKEFRWAEALPLVKAYLLEHPWDAGGHFLLGQCYLRQPTAYPALAEGEFQTALTLLERTGDPGGLSAFLSNVAFKAGIYREMARLYMRQAHDAMGYGIPFPYVRGQLEKALAYAQQGLEIAPDSKELGDMESALKSYLGPGTRQPEQAPADSAAQADQPL